MSDFTIAGGGTVYLLVPESHAAQEWVAENLPEDVQTLGRGIAVEHRFIGAIVDGILADGLEVQ